VPVQRRYDIDRAKGLAILLVVFGHLMSSGYPPGNGWYDTAKDIIYSFHMPFFMYLSGTVFAFAGKQWTGLAAYPSYLKDRAMRLLVPFAVFGLLIVVGKYISHFFLYVDDPPRRLSTGIGRLVLDTHRSPALSIWYVYVLFCYSAAMPLLWRMGLRWGMVAVLGAGLFALPVTDTLYLDRVAGYFVFFALGGLIAAHRSRIEPWFRRALPLWLLLFAATLATEWTALPVQARLLLCGVAAIPALHGLVQSRLFARDRLLLALGDYAFTIYLLNTIVIGLAKAGYLKLAPFHGASATFALALFFAVGTLVPILVRRCVADRAPALARLMR
jgi:fucose 4-O-acetylase-like acetyltransferase